jgi:hypothetical protein
MTTETIKPKATFCGCTVNGKRSREMIRAAAATRRSAKRIEILFELADLNLQASERARLLRHGLAMQEVVMYKEPIIRSCALWQREIYKINRKILRLRARIEKLG